MRQPLRYLVCGITVFATACTSAPPQLRSSPAVLSPVTTTTTTAHTAPRFPAIDPQTPTRTPKRAQTPGRSHPKNPHAEMPGARDSHHIYQAAGANKLSAQVRRDPAYAYVPHNKSGDIWVIDQHSHRVVRKCFLGGELQHVVPSYDLRQLYATSDTGNKILTIDPATGKCGRRIAVIDPYNIYFTPDGRYAISVAEQHRELIWYNPKTWKKHDVTPVPQCAGVDHADFSADGRTAVFTCEFAGRVAVVDVVSHRLLRLVDMPVRNTMMGPQDIKLSPDGHCYYIADSQANGVWVLNAAATSVQHFIATGRGAHGLYLSRDSRRLFVTNRLDGSISVLNAQTGARETKWRIPGGGSPDMGNVSADGSQLWVSGRYHNVVYVLSTRNGRLLAKIPVGHGPHGLALMPIPGRYSLGHTGITR